MTHVFRENPPFALLACLALLAGCGAPATLSHVQRGDRVQTTLAGISSAEVKVVRPGLGMLTPPPRHLQKGDQLSTGPTTRVLLRFARAYVLVEPNTRVSISSLILEGPEEEEPPPPANQGNPIVTEPAGKILVRAGWPISVGTTYISAEVKGTEYGLSLDAKGRSVLRTHHGTVAVSSRSRAWPTIDVHEGEAVFIDGAAAPAKRVLTPEDMAVLDAAFEAFDRLLDLNAF
jgi:hypothetical protein